MSNNLKIDLKASKDRDKATIYIGKLKAPCLIDCTEGVTFIVFVSDNGQEELQICPMEKNK